MASLRFGGFAPPHCPGEDSRFGTHAEPRRLQPRERSLSRGNRRACPPLQLSAARALLVPIVDRFAPCRGARVGPGGEGRPRGAGGSTARISRRRRVLHLGGQCAFL
jgi:hypothetical protein